MSLVVIGTTFIDIKGFPLGEFIPTGRNAARVIEVHGGVARNVAEDVAGLGLPVTFLSLIDDSGSGRDIVERLTRHGVNTEYMRCTPDGMGTWLAIFNEEGDVYANVSKRPDLLPICDILREQGDRIFAGADSILVEIDMEEPILDRIFALSEKYGKDVYAVISNMSIAMERLPYIRKCRCFVCNQLEASMLFEKEGIGSEITVEDLCLNLPDYLLKIGIGCMVVTLGSKGAVSAIAGDAVRVIPAEKVEVIDTTGAGDAFFSGVAAGLTTGKTLTESCQLGSRMAASVISSNDNVYHG